MSVSPSSIQLNRSRFFPECSLGYYERKYQKYTMTEISNQVSAHYQNQFMKQLHVLVLGLDVLGNPFGVIRGLAEGVESFFYEPYKGAIEGPMEFAEGLATGVQSLLGSAAGGAAGAFSKITGVLGKGLATLTFDDDYKASRIRRKEPGGGAASDIAIGGKNVVMVSSRVLVSFVGDSSRCPSYANRASLMV